MKIIYGVRISKGSFDYHFEYIHFCTLTKKIAEDYCYKFNLLRSRIIEHETQQSHNFMAEYDYKRYDYWNEFHDAEFLEIKIR